MREPIDLDVDAPGKVADVLRRAAQAYYESGAELESAWQDPGPRQVWSKIARILERAAVAIDKAIDKAID
jgi:hypothetical protein